LNEQVKALMGDAAAFEGASMLADAEFLEDLRRQMHKFATSQLSDSHLAEDAVQEALMGALKNVKSFAGRAALRTWVFAILKNKIADVLRQKQRSIKVNRLLGEEAEEDSLAQRFDAQGYWQKGKRPSIWANPEGCMQEGQFWHVFETCLNNLPGSQARVFMMREFIELDSHEICATVGITVSNLNVMLFRARVRLRECLEKRWFVDGER
jgi:RNA polymerase sigma-70 factor (ECF subfamily)